MIHAVIGPTHDYPSVNHGLFGNLRIEPGYHNLEGQLIKANPDIVQVARVVVVVRFNQYDHRTVPAVAVSLHT